MKNSYEPLLDNIPVIRKFIEQQMEASDFSSKSVMQVCIAVEEIVTNIIYHGHLSSHDVIDISFTDGQDTATIQITDMGVPFNPLNAPPTDTESPLVERKAGGLGLFFVRQFIDKIHYERINDRNHIYLHKNR